MAPASFCVSFAPFGSQYNLPIYLAANKSTSFLPKKNLAAGEAAWKQYSVFSHPVQNIFAKGY